MIPVKDEHDHSILPATYLEKLFIFALMWSLGALLELDDRVKMEEFMLGHESKLNYPQIEQESGHTIFEFVVNSQGMSVINGFLLFHLQKKTLGFYSMPIVYQHTWKNNLFV